jgi:hypothetical protein
MRLTLIACASLFVAMQLGCEAPAPPQLVERPDSGAPAPPEPAAPAEPAPVVKPGEPKAGTAEAEGAKALAKARALAAQRAGKGAPPADGTAPADPAAPPADAPSDPAATPPADAPPGDQLSKAEAGVGVKGKDYGGPGIITTPIATYFSAQERIAFEAQIPNAMKIYKAGHDNNGPKTHEEYMDVIIKENGVALPELPEGSTYWYDPQSEQLMVRTAKAEP